MPAMRGLLVAALALAALPGAAQGEDEWLGQGAVALTVDELVHHFKPDAGEHKSAFSDRLVKRLYAHQDELRPIYDCAPKTANGHLDQAAIGSALHRHFARRYGMHLRGLDSFGDPSGVPSPAAARVEEFALHAIEKGLAGDGFTNRELSIMAVAVEHLIHEETRGILQRVYDMFKVSVDDSLTGAQAQDFLEAYVVTLLSNRAPGGGYEFTPEAVAAGRKHLEETKGALLALCKEHFRARLFSDADVAHSIVLGDAESFEQELGAIHEKAFCDARHKAVTCDASGRVPLSELRREGFAGLSSPEDWEARGIVERDGHAEPMVNYANWLASGGNCGIRTDYYTICCANPCEDLISKVEREVKAPSLQEAHIEKIVPLLNGSLAGSGPQGDELRARLKGMISGGAGINIYGAEFASFLHFARPCDCPAVKATQMPASAGSRGEADVSSSSTSLPPPAVQSRSSERGSGAPLGEDHETEAKRPDVLAAAPRHDDPQRLDTAVRPVGRGWKIFFVLLCLAGLALGLPVLVKISRDYRKRASLKPRRRPLYDDYDCDMKGIV